jgi:FkbM family methyltransferase
MTFVSYAQNFEDVILWRALSHVSEGFYIDLGAQEPRVDSVSLAFHERGWRGLHVEPVPYYAELLRVERPDDEVLQVAVGGRGEKIDFYCVPGTGLSTSDAETAARHERAGFPAAKRISVPCLDFSSLLEKHAPNEIHWCKIDVEGMERAVLESWEPSSKRPWIVVIESTKPNSPEPSHEEWEPIMFGLGYEFVYFDGLNRFYVHQTKGDLKRAFGPGPNVLDHFVLSEDHALCALARSRVDELEKKCAALEFETARQKSEIDAIRVANEAARGSPVLRHFYNFSRPREVSKMPVREDDVRELYRLLLGREAESDEAVKSHTARHNLLEVVRGFVQSDEYRIRRRNT